MKKVNILNEHHLISVIENLRKGTGQRVLYRKPLELYKAVQKANPTLKVEKETTMVVRFGLDYNNLKAVKEERALNPNAGTGELIGRAWRNGHYKYVLDTNKGKTLIRCYATMFAPKTRYLLNGNPVPKSAIEQYCTATALRPNEEAKCFDLNADYVIAIGK